MIVAKVYVSSKAKNPLFNSPRTIFEKGSGEKLLSFAMGWRYWAGFWD